MKVEIVMIGTELLLGQIVDTNAAHMGRVLAENGINLFQKSTVGDNPDRIKKTLAGALERADAVLTSGGLGPTEDDITRECIAELLGCPLEFSDEAYRQVAARFAKLGRPMTENNKKQALVPRGGHIIENPNGTAPGLIIDDPREGSRGGVIVCMPGVPSELYPMLGDSVIPYLRRRFGVSGVLHSRVLKVCGVGESRVDAAIGDLIRLQSNPTVGVLASPEWVRIRITARAADVAEADALIDEVDATVRERLPGLIMGVNDDTLEGVVNSLLEQRDWTLAVAETDTGGMVGQRLMAARARAFVGGVVLKTGPDASLGPFKGHKAVELALARNADDAAHVLADAVRTLYKANCGLATVYNEAEQKTVGFFHSPEGGCEWSVSYPGTDELHQIRVSVFSVEQVRRWLTGYDA